MFVSSFVWVLSSYTSLAQLFSSPPDFVGVLFCCFGFVSLKPMTTNLCLPNMLGTRGLLLESGQLTGAYAYRLGGGRAVPCYIDHTLILRLQSSYHRQKLQVPRVFSSAVFLSYFIFWV